MGRSLGMRQFAIQRQNLEQKASVNYSWTSCGVHHDKIRRQHAVRASKEHLATLGHRITHTHTLPTCNS